jgi:hypothetical protein
MTHGELEARILDADRAQASAPPDVSRELRLTAQAEADAWQQSADAEIGGDQAGWAGAAALARHMAAQREQLEAANARYETWTADTSSRREAGGRAKAELERRELAQQAAGQRQAEPEDGPQTMAGWWRQLEANLAAVDRAIEREHQAAIAAGEPWPPERNPSPRPSPCRTPKAVPKPTRKPMVRPARMTRQPDLTGYVARPPKQPSVSLPKTRPGRSEPSTPLVSNEKPMQNPSTPCKSKSPTRQTLNCKSRRVGVVGNDTTRFLGSELAGPPGVRPAPPPSWTGSAPTPHASGKNSASCSRTVPALSPRHATRSGAAPSGPRPTSASYAPNWPSYSPRPQPQTPPVRPGGVGSASPKSE